MITKCENGYTAIFESSSVCIVTQSSSIEELGIMIQDAIKLKQKIETKESIKALEAYLSAGSKEDRRKASILAKEVYKKLTGIEYKNP